jgi:hypothetical protein
LFVSCGFRRMTASPGFISIPEQCHPHPVDLHGPPSVYYSLIVSRQMLWPRSSWSRVYSPGWFLNTRHRSLRWGFGRRQSAIVSSSTIFIFIDRFNRVVDLSAVSVLGSATTAAWKFHAIVPVHLRAEPAIAGSLPGTLKRLVHVSSL